MHPLSNKDFMMLTAFFENKTQKNDYRMFVLDEFSEEEEQALVGMIHQMMGANRQFAEIVINAAAAFQADVKEALKQQQKNQFNLDITPFIKNNKSKS